MISIRTDEEIADMKRAGKIAFDLLNYLENVIKEGITTKEIDTLSEKFVINRGGKMECKGYEGFPASVCTSVNEEVVHGIPGKKKLRKGDIITVDLVVSFNGMMADTARTYKVGNVSSEVDDLLTYTKEALYAGISKVKAGVKLNEISKAIEAVAKEHGLGIVRELTGHGIGKEMHEDPCVYNYSNNESELILEEGMTIAIEPMFTLGKRNVWLMEDDWTICTQDGKQSAHYEHTVVVTKEGYEILTGE
jgi:methionyl aminopeptidase